MGTIFLSCLELLLTFCGAVVPIKDALRRWVLVNTNYPVVTNIKFEEKTAHSVIISVLSVDVSTITHSL